MQLGDVTDAVSSALSVKDAKEVSLMQTSAAVTTKLFRYVVCAAATSARPGSHTCVCANSKLMIAPMEDALEDEGDAPTHTALTTKAEAVFSSPDKLASMLKSVNGVSVDLVDSCYAPTFMSGGNYDLKVRCVRCGWLVGWLVD